MGEASLPSWSPGDGAGRLPHGVSRQRGPLGAKLGSPEGEVMEKMAEFSTGFWTVWCIRPDCFALVL